MTAGGGPGEPPPGPRDGRSWPGADRQDDDDLPALFVAVPLPDAAAGEVADVVGRVRARHAGGREVRWVRLDGLHLTIRFLGPTGRERIAHLAAAVDAVAAAGAPFPVEVAGTGSFPERGRPRVLWLGIRQGASELMALSEALDAALAGLGWPATDRPFRGHLTLARADGVAAGPATTELLREELGTATIAGRLDRLVLFRSRTGGGPARYEPLHVAPLGGGGGDQGGRGAVVAGHGSAGGGGPVAGASIAPSASPGLLPVPGQKEPQPAS